ncbi:hypothetical protein A3Q56_02065 [Intoshia linei]|uniref:Transcription initiation factor TFIID subunit 10 n=1 Tax=Intoshia linei TaxID=1819745 RepID=A0A177B7C3_9BILA|nr:hypothetical protein A3Q56_02065 [Intoshia linei]
MHYKINISQLKTKDQKLLEKKQLLHNITNENCGLIIPDALISNSLTNAGSDTRDMRIIRLVSLLTQKFADDVLKETFENTQMKMTESKKNKSNKISLKLDELFSVLQEKGIDVTKIPRK